MGIIKLVTNTNILFELWKILRMTNLGCIWDEQFVENVTEFW